jgi:pimeloyl-ACP methyl ester carboxylesterase
VVLCVHGLTRNSRDFDAAARNLAGRGLRVVAPDLPGRGRSAWLDDASEYATPLYLSVMTALIARTGAATVDWIGTSLGGHIGMEMAALPGNPIRRLVLNDFGARVGAAALHRIAAYVTVRRRFGSIDEVEAYLRSVHAFGALTDEQWQHLARHSAMRESERGYRLHYDPAIGRQFAWLPMLDINLWDVWEKVACPVLVLRGAESDLLAAGTVRDMLRRGKAGRAGKVQSVEVAGCGHAPSLMDDQVMETIWRFLSARDSERAVVRDSEQAVLRGTPA